MPTKAQRRCCERWRVCAEENGGEPLLITYLDMGTFIPDSNSNYNAYSYSYTYSDSYSYSYSTSTLSGCTLLLACPVVLCSNVDQTGLLFSTLILSTLLCATLIYPTPLCPTPSHSKTVSHYSTLP